MTIKKQSTNSKFLSNLIGPTATHAEIILQFLPPFLFSLLTATFSTQPPLQRLLSCLLAFDLLGGVLTNSTTSAKLWYHRPAVTPIKHLSFVVLHVLHVLLVAIVFRDRDFVFAISVSLYLVISACLVVFVADYVKRVVAMGLYCGAVILEFWVWGKTYGLDWFVPLFFLKLLVAHLLPA